MTAWARACALLFALAPLACRTNFGAFRDDARASFATDHGCNQDATTVVERPDLQSTSPRGALLAYEVRGCNAHDLVQCDQHRYSPSCGATAFCETPGCTSDYEGVSKRAFSEATTCPLDRVAAVRGVTAADVAALAPPEIASDPERMTLWVTRYQKRLADAQSDTASPFGTTRATLVFVKGCAAARVYECVNSLGVGAPTCEPVNAP